MRGTKERLADLFHFAQIRCAADQDKTPVTIAAINRAALIDLQPDLWMAQRRGHIGPAAIAGNTAGADKDCFGRIDHLARLAKANGPRNFALH